MQSGSQMPLKLHLGAGSVRITNFVNVDMFPSPAVDVVADIRLLIGISENTIDTIYTSNVLEHFQRFEYPLVLQRWHQVLKPGGILRLSVPDLEAVCKYYVETGNLDDIMMALYSGQQKPLSFHYWGWDYKTLERDLKQAGFKEVRRYDRDKTEHADIKDWSLNFLPPQYGMNGESLSSEEWVKGTNIALNVEAVK